MCYAGISSVLLKVRYSVSQGSIVSTNESVQCYAGISSVLLKVFSKRRLSIVSTTESVQCYAGISSVLLKVSSKPREYRQYD